MAVDRAPSKESWRRRTKIVATIGPTSDSPALLERLIKAGVDTTRQNFSHGTAQYHEKLFKRIRKVSRLVGKPIACLADLQGPRIRVGRLKDGRAVQLVRGAEVRLNAASAPGDAQNIPVRFEQVQASIKPGHRVLIADGAIELRVLKAKGGEFLCRVARGGLLGEHKGVNLPDTPLRLPGLTAKDHSDARVIARLGFDYVALSFVRSGEHVRELRRLLERLGSRAHIIAKIENPRAVRNLDEILDASDGIMVARGDLAVETSPGAVPVLQKEIIRRTNQRSKIVITATEMLASMIDHPQPTRAEASDVANAVFDHTDATMLSGETASGSYPVESVRTMSEILIQAERYRPKSAADDFPAGRTFTHAAVHSAVIAAETVQAHCIAVFTHSGNTALIASEARPGCPIVALTPLEETRRRLALVWGVTPVHRPRVHTFEKMMRTGAEALLKTGLARPGQTVVFVAGTSLRSGATNVVRIDKLS